jgi:putative transposase
MARHGVSLLREVRAGFVTHPDTPPSARHPNSRIARRPKPGDTWHLDEVFLKINGELHYLWRAVDQHGVVLDILVQDRRNATAAKRFFRRLLAGLKYKPKRLVTDGLRSYGVAHCELMP